MSAGGAADALEDGCRSCRTGEAHAIYVVLLTDRRYVHNPQAHTTLTWIDVTESPRACVRSHNGDPKYVPGNQLTKAGAPNYQLELVCGPFRAYSAAQRMAADCRAKSRKLVNRVRYFAWYFKSRLCGHDLHLYARDKLLVERYWRQGAAAPAARSRRR